MSDTSKPQSRGGQARAKSLSPSERSAIARKAARERWSSQVLPAICGSADNPLSIGGVEIECYVLEDGTRVVTQRSCAILPRPKVELANHREEFGPRWPSERLQGGG